MEKTTLTDLSQREREELESILLAHRQGPAGDQTLARGFHSTFQDAFVWWLFLLLISVGGIIAWFVNWRVSNMIEDWRYLIHNPAMAVNAPQSLPVWAGLPACILVALWATRAIARNYKRRGYAATSYALVRVRGKKLALVNHVNLTAIKWAHAGSRGKTFCVLDLKPTEGDPLRLYPKARWVETALEQVAAARAAAGLPMIQPEVTWGTYYRKVEVPRTPA